ncbi:ABC transporter permease [Erwinia sorbitola]|uniref:ABC transporter permease subunit n=1 Tax=Erwinia sorbitola TaxID=2681984 RepID=A0A6I6EDM9_9GAMM|nr:ABC transporter permease [Erwinia sorbitola]MTD25496.1 ABC transporter permease subunit [Erwinia sorbitola]QGU87937.1 ABC transporter permease subunit [Erwinia sorbitola]
MIRILGYRLLQAGMVALLVGSLTFVLMRSLPGDIAWRIAAGRYGYDRVDASAASAVQQELGLDRPAWQALADWFIQLLHVNPGNSLVSGAPVMEEINHQLGQTLLLAAVALLLSLLLGPPLGILAGLAPGGKLDRLLLAISTSLRALPHFVLGLILVLIFALGLGWLPAAGYGEVQHVLLPALTLALGLAAVSSRVARNAMRQVTDSAWYQFGRTKGLTESQLFWQHGLRNVSVPLVTYLSVQFIYLIEGVIVVETLFAWPGIGHALVHAIFARDVPMIQGTALIMGLMFVLLNTLSDGLCYWLDPRRKNP